ncbi:MAG: helix-turn-helix transcriptional regulator [Planctomycetes bacterium]|nr:helix-turn-helix transcriptional regulator [Planctomycetota bacterium]
MIETQIHHVHQFTDAEKASYTQQTHTISLICAGFYSFSVNGRAMDRLHSLLHFTPAGSQIELECLSNRENWVISFSSEHIRQGTDQDRFDIYFNNEWLSLPRVVHIPREHISGWRGEFMRMRDSFLNPMGIDQFRTQLGLMNIWRYFVTGEPDRYTLSAANRLKNMIDRDSSFEQNIAQLCSNLDGSKDHLRLLFKKQYGMTPIHYRNQRRMAIATDLIANSDFTIQAIAKTCGFSQVSHFSASYSKEYDESPRSAMKRFRSA